MTDDAGQVRRAEPATCVAGNDPSQMQVAPPGTGMVGATVAVRFTLTDSTIDLASVELELSLDGGQTFGAATFIDRAPPVLAGRQSGTAGVATDATAREGIEHTFVWDAAHNLGNAPRVVFIRVTPADSQVGAASGPFTYDPLVDTVTGVCGLPSGE